MGPLGTANSEVTITVTPLHPAAIFTATPMEVSPGEGTVLSWNSAGAERAFIDNGIGEVPLTGSITVTPTYTTEYTLNVTGILGIGQERVRVRIQGNPLPPEEGDFGYEYQDQIPGDTAILSYDAERFAVIKGFILDVAENPLEGVFIKVLGHPEYGTTETDSTGRYSIAVEGGKVMTIEARKSGYLEVHRKVDVRWNGVSTVDTAKMVPEETNSMDIHFDGNPSNVYVHQNVGITDDRGSRRSSTVFAGDNTVYLVDENGNDVAPLETITLRATEFPTPDSMPGLLPPNSAFTYCVEISVDGADRVRFEKPIVSWVDNFLGFAVGSHAPVGLYNRDSGKWEPAKSGRVVKLLDTNGDGVVDSLDVDGDGLPDDLTEDGTTSDEVIGLSNPQAYTPDTVLWRIELEHLTPCDINWPLGLPPDAKEPDPELGVDSQDHPHVCPTCPNPVQPNSSDIDIRAQTLHEDVPITGTGLALHYSSERTKGYIWKLRVPVSGASSIGTLRKIVAICEVAGNRFEQELPPLPNQVAEFTWDGLDFDGNRSPRSGALVSIGFVYDIDYWTPQKFREVAFGQPGSDSTGVNGRDQFTFWKRQTYNPGRADRDSKGFIATGWTLSPVHHFNSSDPSTLHLGSGATLEREENERLIQTYAGGGRDSIDPDNGDGGKATEAWIYNPYGINFDEEGNLYICEEYSNVIRKVDRQGIITTIAGTGEVDSTGTPLGRGDGGPAIFAKIYRPTDIVIDDQGNTYITTDRFVRKIDSAGIITTFAGSDYPGYESGSTPAGRGDNGPATNARLSTPEQVAVDSSGNVYIVDSSQGVIRKVAPDGVITTIAGNGASYSGPFPFGDGELAIDVPLGSIRSIEIDGNGNIYFLQLPGGVRKIDVSGFLSTVAGGGSQTIGIDGLPATEVDLPYLWGMTIDKRGNLYLGDSYRVLKVSPQGVIFTEAGDLAAQTLGDGGLARNAAFRDIIPGLAVDPKGDLFVVDWRRNTIRRIYSPGPHTASEADYNLPIGQVLFPDSSGLGYVIDKAGRHQKTIDLITGNELLTIVHNPEGQLSSFRRTGTGTSQPGEGRRTGTGTSQPASSSPDRGPAIPLVPSTPHSRPIPLSM